MNKRLFVLPVLFLIFSGISNAQFYFNAGAGYSIPAFKQEVYSYGQSITGFPVLIQNQSNGDIEDLRTSFNQGLHLRAGVGYSFSNLFGLELNADIQKPKEIEARRAFANQILNYKLKGGLNSLTLSPILNFKTGIEKLSIFVKPGITLGITKINEEHQFIQNNFPIESGLTMDGGVVTGLNLAAGVAYAISDMFSVYGEATAASLQYRPKNSRVERYSINGQNAKDNLAFTEFTLSDTYQFVPNPNIRARKAYPFSGIQFNIGVRISPWKGEKRARFRSADNPFSR